MRLIGLDILEEFYAQNQHLPWAWEVDALVTELANREWAGASELVHDYPTAEAEPPAVVFSVAGGRILVSCLILFGQGIVLIKEFIPRKAQKENKKSDVVGGTA